MKLLSAGLLMYRFKDGAPQVLLVHPGGPFWQNKDDGAWGLPKGEADDGEMGEQLLNVAKREFEEETSFKPVGEMVYLGAVKRARDGKVVEAWMFEGDCDPSKIKSNTIVIDWPPKSGKKTLIPEIDRGAFFTPEEAKIKISEYQRGFIEMFEKVIKV